MQASKVISYDEIPLLDVNEDMSVKDDEISLLGNDIQAIDEEIPLLLDVPDEAQLVLMSRWLEQQFKKHYKISFFNKLEEKELIDQGDIAEFRALERKNTQFIKKIVDDLAQYKAEYQEKEESEEELSCRLSRIIIGAHLFAWINVNGVEKVILKEHHILIKLMSDFIFKYLGVKDSENDEDKLQYVKQHPETIQCLSILLAHITNAQSIAEKKRSARAEFFSAYKDLLSEMLFKLEFTRLDYEAVSGKKSLF